MVNKLFTKIEHLFYRSKINPFATLYINLRCLPFKQALKMPIIVYGNVSFPSLSGRIVFLTENIKHGQLIIGKRFCRTQGRTRICIDGTFTVGKNVVIEGGTEVHVRPKAELIINEGSQLFEDCMVFCYERIEIGKFSRIAYHANILDTDFHFCIDVSNRKIGNHTKPIKIGNYNWIGNKATIKKGTITPDFTIVAASYSLLNKDYTEICPPYPILGGLPAKVIGSGKRRVFNLRNQSMLELYFSRHKGETYNCIDDIDHFCLFE